MPRPAQQPLRDLTDAERAYLVTLGRATSERVDVRQRAVAVLAVAEGQSYTVAARRAGYAGGGALSPLVQRGNPHGLAAPAGAPGRGRQTTSSVAQRQQHLDQRR